MLPLGYLQVLHDSLISHQPPSRIRNVFADAASFPYILYDEVLACCCCLSCCCSGCRFKTVAIPDIFASSANAVAADAVVTSTAAEASAAGAADNSILEFLIQAHMTYRDPMLKQHKGQQQHQ